MVELSNADRIKDIREDLTVLESAINQKDILYKQSYFDSLMYRLVRLGVKNGIDTPVVRGVGPINA